MKIGEAARKAREKAGLTQRELAEKSGYSGDAISIIENDRKTPRITTIIDLADALGISVDEYIGHKTNSKKGKWVKKYPQYEKVGLYYCSVCKKTIDIGTGMETPINRGMFYCGNCGADLREGAKK